MAQALTIDKPKRWDVPFSRELPDPAQRRELSEADLDRLLAAEPFSTMDPRRFPRSLPLREILRNDTRIRRYKRGEVIVRAGDYGNSAFLILRGGIRVILKGLDPTLLGRRQRLTKSPLRSLMDLFSNPKAPEARNADLYPQMHGEGEEAAGRAVAVQDVTNVLNVFPEAFEKTKNELMVDSQQYRRMTAGKSAPANVVEGQLVGELSALGRLPRTATIVADGDAELLEIRWQGLRDLRKYDDALRQHVDNQFRKYGLVATLRGSPLMSHLSDDAAKQVAAAAAFETYGSFDWYGTYQQLRAKGGDPLANEPIIAEQGHYPNGLLLIRAGFARLSRKRGNGEQTVSYLGKGDVYGLAELVHNAQHEKNIPLGATLRAVGYVDVVRIPTREFEQLILPNIPRHLLPEAPRPIEPPDSLQPASAAPSAAPETAHDIDPAILEFLVENRFINGTATMMIDLDRCTRCDDCVRACASGHTNNPRFVRHGRIFGHHMVANACMHCADPVCMIGCPTGAIHRTETTGEVVINDITCIGCGTCAASCPYDNIRMVEVRDRQRGDAIMIDPKEGKPIVKATKCDLCVDHRGGPACERACPHDALKRVDMRDMRILSRWLNR